MQLKLTFCGGTYLWKNGMVSQCYGTLKGSYSSDITVYSDVSGSWGCGAFWQQKWLVNTVTDLFHCRKGTSSSVVAAALYGSQWSGKIIIFRVDNIAVIA